MYNIYTKEQLDEFEETGELFVCTHCGHEGHSDDFGNVCPKCGESFEDNNEMPKLTYKQIYNFVKNHKETKHIQRLGQHFCNEFDIIDSYLFYCPDDNESLGYIYLNYCNYQRD